MIAKRFTLKGKLAKVLGNKLYAEALIAEGINTPKTVREATNQQLFEILGSRAAVTEVRQMIPME